MEHWESGIALRIEREKQQLSLRSLAKKTGISSSQLSKIERGIISGNTMMMQSIFNALNIDYSHFLKAYGDSKPYFMAIYHDIIYRRHHTPIENVPDTLDRILIYTTSSLIEHHHDPSLDPILLFLQSIVDQTTTFYKEWIYQCIGLYYYKQNKFTKALEIFLLASELRTDDLYQAVTFYYLGNTYLHTGDAFKAYDHLNQAKLLFDRQHNYIRSSICSKCMGDVFLFSGKYHEALSMYLDILPIYDQFPMPTSETVALYRSLAMTYVSLNQNNECLLLANKIDELNNDVYFQLFLMIANVHLQHHEKAYESILHLHSIVTEDFDKDLVYFYNLKLQHKDKECRSFLEHVHLDHFSLFYRQLLLKQWISDIEDLQEYRLLYQYTLAYLSKKRSQ